MAKGCEVSGFIKKLIVDTDVLQQDEDGDWQWCRCVDRVDSLHEHVEYLLQGMREGAWRAFRVVRAKPFTWY